MFDTHHHGGQTHHTVTKHEHRAPTDDSIRIYKELVEKAEARVVSTMACDFANVVEAISFEKAMTPATRGTKFYVAFKLNGRDYSVEVEREDAWVGALTPARALGATMELLTKAICAELVKVVMDEWARKEKP